MRPSELNAVESTQLFLDDCLGFLWTREVRKEQNEPYRDAEAQSIKLSGVVFTGLFKKEFAPGAKPLYQRYFTSVDLKKTAASNFTVSSKQSMEQSYL